MARYIDADWIYEKVENRYRLSSGIEHRCERDLLDLICSAPTADVVPKSEEGAECPTCHGTGRIGTTDWLTKGISKKQLAEEKAKAVAEHEQHIKTEVAREIFAEIEKHLFVITPIEEFDGWARMMLCDFERLKKKYTEGKEDEGK